MVQWWLRRGGRVVDRTRLESGLTFTGNGSSNLPLSASIAARFSRPLQIELPEQLIERKRTLIR